MTRTHGAFCTVAEYERLLEVDQRSPHQEAEIARLTRERNALRAGFERACQTVYDEIEPTCGQAMAQMAYHAVKTELRHALANADKETGG